MSARLTIGFCAALALAFPSAAFAQRATVWAGLASEPGADATLPPAALEAAAQACVARHVSVVALSQVERELGSGPLSRCASADCAREMARHLGIDAVVLVTMWQRSGQPATIVVEVVGADQAFTSPEVAVDDDLASAVRRATNQAWALWETGQSVRVQLTSEPAGATVREGDDQLGVTPFYRRMSLGEHHLQFSLAGFSSQSRTITVTRDLRDPIHLELERAGSAAPTTGSGPDIGVLSSGIALAVLGAAGIAVVAVSASQTGCVETAANGACAIERRLHDGPTYGFGVGGAIALAGGLVLVGVSFVMGGDGEVTVEAGPGSVQLRGRF